MAKHNTVKYLYCPINQTHEWAELSLSPLQTFQLNLPLVVCCSAQESNRGCDRCLRHDPGLGKGDAGAS
jgi:hypothetical protein